MGDQGAVVKDVAFFESFEKGFAEDIEGLWKVDLRKDIRKMAPIDFMVVSRGTDVIEGYIELKVRTFKSTAYKETMIDHVKMASLRQKGEMTGLPIYLAIRFTDKDSVYELNPSRRFRIEHNGRTRKTRTAYDIKEVEYIPLHHFRELKKENK